MLDYPRLFTFFLMFLCSFISKHSTVTIFEPLSPTRTQMLIYRATNLTSDGVSTDIDDAKRDAGFVKDAGFDEDREAACAIQGTLGTKANQHLTFGHFEKAIAHFHKNLAQHLSS